MGSVMASTRGNFLKAREYFCILLSFLELSLVRQPPTRFICSSPFSVSKKKMPTKSLFSLGISWNSRSVWLQAAFHFGTENWDDQLKNTMYKKEWVFSRNKVLWGCSCSENALCLVPYLPHSRLLTKQRCWQVSNTPENLDENQNFRKIYINGKLNFEVTTKFIPEVGPKVLTYKM